MITGLEWVIIGFFVGAATAVFWDEITAWASKIWRFIVDAINTAIEVVSSALVYLINEAGSFYKQVKVYVMNKFGKVRLETRRQEISRFEIPSDVLQELERKREIMVMKTSN